MFTYRCPSCNALAYSAANSATVGPCHRCGAALASPPAGAAGAVRMPAANAPAGRRRLRVVAR